MAAMLRSRPRVARFDRIRARLSRFQTLVFALAIEILMIVLLKARGTILPANYCGVQRGSRVRQRLIFLLQIA